MTIERRRLIIIAAVALFAAAGARITAQQQQQPPAQPQQPPVGPMARILGQALFNQHCASCHQHAMTAENQTPIVIGGRPAPSTETPDQFLSPMARIPPPTNAAASTKIATHRRIKI